MKMKRPRTRRSKIAAFIAGAIIIIGGGTGGFIVVHPGGGPTFNLAVSPTGNDATCVRGNINLPCLTWQKAENLAQCGDYVKINDGTYLKQEIDRGTDKACGAGTCDQSQVNASTPPTGTTSGCVTFEPGSSSCSVTVGSSTTLDYLWTNATYLRIDGRNCMTIDGGLFLIGKSANLGGTSDSCNSGYGHDDIIQNTVFDGTFSEISSPTISEGVFFNIGTHNVSMIGDTFKNAVTWFTGTPARGVVSQWYDCTGATTSSQSDQTMLKSSVLLDEVKDPAAGGHCEGIHMQGNHGTAVIISTKFEDLCEQDISIEPENVNPIGGSQSIGGITIENSLFDYPSSHAVALGYQDTFNPASFGSITIICHTSGTAFNNVIVRNNSFINKAGSGGYIKYQIDSSSTCTLSGNVATGNIAVGVGSCAFWQTVAKNVIPTGTGCGSDVAFGSSTFPYNNPSGYDVTINSGTAGAVYGAVPLSVGYPSTDAVGTTRPNPADAGMFQH